MKVPGWLHENRRFIAFLVLLGFLRTAVADYNPIPSGSMRPTLLEGDVVLVDRLAYDVRVPLTQWTLGHLEDPQRGDVVTFFSPRDRTRLIKRIVGIPGDVVEMRGDVLSINGVTATYEDPEQVSERLSGGPTMDALRVTERIAGDARRIQVVEGIVARRSFGPVTVPSGEYFMMGDNRDNSEDSRFIGTVPRANIIGRAHHVMVSADILDHWQPRVDRVASRID